MGMSETPPSHEEVTSTIRPVLNRHFKPALVGRMTIVPFFPLKSDAIARIVRLKLGRVANRLNESHKMSLAWDDVIVDKITERCTEVETGARNIDHIIQGSLLPLMSTQILQRMADGPLPDSLKIVWDDATGFALQFGG
jgi:type VI secretion system protein VasG